VKLQARRFDFDASNLRIWGRILGAGGCDHEGKQQATKASRRQPPS
jgi:hypothetical protein